LATGRSSPAHPFIRHFAQSWWIATGGYGGPRWTGITWSFAIEEQFYLPFPFAVYFLPRKWLVAVVISLLVATPVLRKIFERLFGSWYAPYVLLPSRVDGLMFGVAVALKIKAHFTWRDRLDVRSIIRSGADGRECERCYRRTRRAGDSFRASDTLLYLF
jgi:peptidoglycan/LPS O-acetylase OafA/YrhL